MSIHHQDNFSHNQGPTLAGVLGLFAVPLLLISISGLVLYAALAVILFAAGVAFVWGALREDTGANLKPAQVFFALSIVCALGSGLAVFAFEWISFDIAEYLAVGAYIAGLVFGAWGALNKIWKIIAALVAAASVTAMLALPVPKGGENTASEYNKWSVIAIVRDANNEPIPGALVQCAVVMRSA